jgi:ribonuclease HII
MTAKKFDRSLLPPAPNFHYESLLWEQGLTAVAGVDEAGRGALAGPVAAAAVVFPADAELCQTLEGVRDSKVMSPAQREDWAARLPDIARGCAVGFASRQEIDDLGILPATCLAARRAVADLVPVPQHLLIDYIELPDSQIPQTALVKGDARSLSIAAASILAKVARDQYMRELDDLYPGYHFARHKGYGTADHRRALAEFGPSPVHRRSFRLNSQAKLEIE